MSSEYWSGQASTKFDAWAKKRMAKLAELEQGAHIHIVGICGTGTGALLQLLVAQGFYVTGSDKAFYPPMGDLIKKYAAKIFEGYSTNSFSKWPDFVVIGNAAGISNPEVEYVLSNNLAFCSMDEALSVLLVGDRSHCPTSIVVAGTHGKTTTTALTSWLFESAQRNPAYFVGGVSNNFSQTIRGQASETEASQRVVVLEGDEYNSAFFARYSKFHAYRADILIITSLEFDHGDIFDSIESIEEEFSNLVKSMPSSGTVYVSASYPRLLALAKEWIEMGYCGGNIYSYGQNLEANFPLAERQTLNSSCQIIKFNCKDKAYEFELPLSGEHNAENALVASLVAMRCGLNAEQVRSGLSTFKGVLRRQEVLVDRNGVMLIEDFAHHPTAVDKTLVGLKESHQPQRLVVAFDPRSNTSRRHFFQNEYAKAFMAADVIFLKKSDPPSNFTLTGDIIPLNVDKLIEDIKSQGKKAVLCEDADEILDKIMSDLQAGDCIVLMSNASFEGLAQKLKEAVLARQG